MARVKVTLCGFFVSLGLGPSALAAVTPEVAAPVEEELFALGVGARAGVDFLTFPNPTGAFEFSAYADTGPLRFEVGALLLPPRNYLDPSVELGLLSSLVRVCKVERGGRLGFLVCFQGEVGELSAASVNVVPGTTAKDLWLAFGIHLGGSYRLVDGVYGTLGAPLVVPVFRQQAGLDGETVGHQLPAFDPRLLLGIDLKWE